MESYYLYSPKKKQQQTNLPNVFSSLNYIQQSTQCSFILHAYLAFFWNALDKWAVCTFLKGSYSECCFHTLRNIHQSGCGRTLKHIGRAWANPDHLTWISPAWTLCYMPSIAPCAWGSTSAFSRQLSSQQNDSIIFATRQIIGAKWHRCDYESSYIHVVAVDPAVLAEKSAAVKRRRLRPCCNRQPTLSRRDVSLKIIHFNWMRHDTRADKRQEGYFITVTTHIQPHALKDCKMTKGHRTVV